MLGFIIVAALPLDMYTTSIYDEHRPTQDMRFYRDFIQWNWKVCYTITFLLTWIVFPYFMVYAVRGEFTRFKRIWKTFVFNVWIYLATFIFAAGVLPVVYLLVNKDREDKEKVGIVDV